MTDRSSSSDGISGEYRPQPIELEIPPLRSGGRGTAGIESAGEMSHQEHVAAVRAGDIGSIHSWELVTGVDGPGTRMTVFVSGCPLRCQFCHNPDTMFAAKGESVRVGDLVERLRRYRGVFKATHGGLTISGGEPLMQPAFTGRLLHAAHEMGVHTALDTSGFLGANATDAMLDNVDLVLLDVKSGLPDTYRDVTRAELEPTLVFGRRLAERGIEIWIRFVLVPGLNDAVENVDAVADYVATLSTVTRVEVLPFHQMGRDKWATLGLPYTLSDTTPPSKELLDRVRGQFAGRGLTVY